MRQKEKRNGQIIYICETISKAINICDIQFISLIYKQNFRSIFHKNYSAYAFNMFPSRNLPANANDNNIVPT